VFTDELKDIIRTRRAIAVEQQFVVKESDGQLLETDSHPQAESVQPATWSDYLHLTKPGITLSNLMTTFTGFWLAVSSTNPEWTTLEFVHKGFLTLLGTALVIASGAALNNYYDRELDAKMKRTKNRAVASGRIHPRYAITIGVALLLVGLLTLMYVNPLTAVFGLIGHILYVLVYTPLKRVTTLNTVIGGLSGAVPPVIGWVAVSNSLDMGAWILFLILFLWQPPHFLALAMLKAEEYRAGGIPMLPVVKGFAETKRQMFNYAAALLPASLLLMLYANVGYIYLVAAMALGGVYLWLSVKGFSVKEEDDLVWARKMFGFSLLYLTAICAAVMISSIPF
jgi:protoheme IX farnesyltransferase